MIRKIIAFFVLLSLVYMAFNSESAIAVNTNDSNRFSAESTIPYLEEIAKAPHPMGSLENKEVRDYVANTLRDLGLEVRIETGYTEHSWKPTYNRMAYVENIIATLKGSNPDGKKVVLAGHYDSVFEGPGAADDGYAVASMIETVKLLKDQLRKNDIELLITDGEEMGLFGARYYAENNDLSNIGIFLNYEARGNEGPGLAFEYSDNNAWLIEEMKKVSKRPIANSLSFEIYKRMPNASDFTVFLREGVQGINYAFIDGFSYYHNPVDNVENLSKESVQHTGENMYLMAKHFANYEFGEVPKENASFFNFYGNLIHYSSKLDLYFLLFGFGLFAFTMFRFLKSNEVKLKNILLSFVSLQGVILLIGGLNFGFAALVKSLYPQYSTFYSYHYYNHEWYFVAGIGLTFLTSWFIGSRTQSKFGNKSIGLGTSLFLLILSILLYVYIPTGTYLMMFPMIAVTTGLLLSEMFKLKTEHWQFWFLGLGMASVMIGFWANLSHNLYLGFSFGALPGAVIPTAIFCFAMIGLLPDLWKKKEFLVPIFGLCLFTFSLVNAHLKSKPTLKAPLKSNLFFVDDRNADQSYWATRDNYINEGHLNRLENSEQGRLPRHLPYSRFYGPTKERADGYQSSFTPFADSTSSSVKVVNPKRASIAYLVFSEIENVDKIFVDGQLNKDVKEGATGYYSSVLYGLGLDSMVVKVVKRDFSKPVEAYINISYQEPFKKEELPKGIVRDDGFTYVSEMVEF